MDREQELTGSSSPLEPTEPEKAHDAVHEYTYGEEPAALSPAADSTPHPDDAPAPSDTEHTAMRAGTAPRAVLREVPAGFPPAPPEAERIHRPAPVPASTPEPPRRSRTPIIIGVIAAVTTLALILAGTAGFFAWRALSSSSDPTPSSTTTASAPSSTTQNKHSKVTQTSIEVGIRAVGSGSNRMQAKGEFIVVTFTVEALSGAMIDVSPGRATLVLKDGTEVPVDAHATRAHTDIPPDGFLSKGSKTFVYVFDAPIGAQMDKLRMDLLGGGTVELPVKG